MPLNKSNLNINFAKGLDTKSDNFQIQAGNFIALNNSVFNVGGRLTKRNGFGLSSTLPSSSDSSFLTTFNGNLTALGSSLLAYNPGAKSWMDKGELTSIGIDTLPIVRNTTNQSQVDSVMAPNGIVCAVYTGQDIPNVGSPGYYYTVIDSATGQSIIAPTFLSYSFSIYNTPRVFLLGNLFVILYTTQPSPGTYNLVYSTISTTNPQAQSTPVTLASTYAPATTVAWDAIVANNILYFAFNTTSGGQSVKTAYLTAIRASQGLGPSSFNTFAASKASMFSMATEYGENDTLRGIWITFYNPTSNQISYITIDVANNTIHADHPITTEVGVLNIASAIMGDNLVVMYELDNAYSYDATLPTHYISYKKVSLSSGTITPILANPGTVAIRSLGLASKAFLYNNDMYFLGAYQSDYQPGYYLLKFDGSTTKIAAKLAYQNGGGYYTTGLPGVTITDNSIKIPYLYKDQLEAVNKSQGVGSSAGVYAQLGINLATFTMGEQVRSTAEIGANLNIPGGFIASYDGVAPVEQNFFVYPDMDPNLDANGTSKSLTVTNGSGSVAAAGAPYYYQVIYEWSDNQGNIIRSAPSIPTVAAAASFSGATNTVVVNIPTLRLSYKSNVKISVYRWSTTQQSYYEVTTIASPLLNNPAVDSVQFTDTYSNDDIIGNSLLYTTGGVLENISPPSSNNVCLFNNRLWLVDAEDRNLLWFSKQVIEATPVEMSDLLTLYVAPTTAAQGSTGPITAIAPMDDKLIVFKRNALGYINGIGPDNTGSNSQYSDFILVNTVVGCANQQSIVLTPNGLMFQSGKGIWLLGRDLSTNYIGAPVEQILDGYTVTSAVNVPSTTQVRFTLNNGIVLMYDYYYNQWGTFSTIRALSSTVYENLHTVLTEFNQVLQETPGQYVDNGSPVLMSFTSGWMNLAGVQGYERFYYMLLLGQYKTPFKLNVQFAFNYNVSPSQSILVTPDQTPSTWGSQQNWGNGNQWGSSGEYANVFEARVFPDQQKVESFQIIVSEVFDPQYSTLPGEGLTLSGMNLVVGLKKGFRTSPASRSFG